MEGIKESTQLNFVQLENTLITADVLQQYRPGMIQVVNCSFLCYGAEEGDYLTNVSGFVFVGSLLNAEKISESCLAIVSTMDSVDRYIGLGDMETGLFTFNDDFSMYP